MQFTDRDSLKNIFDQQSKNRWRIAQTSAQERIQKLQSLRKAIVDRQQEFYKAIWEDFHKSKFEAWLCEIFPTIEEIDCTINNLENWMEDKPVSRVFFLPTTKSYSHFEPKGHVLIMAPWNYPFLLFLNPIVSAVAAGNVIVAKPSHKTPRVSAFLTSLIEDTFPANEIAVIEGPGAQIGDELLKLPFDHIFFTGSPKVGAHIAEEAAKIHASITLELGGKSPAVILNDVNLKDAAEKLAWGKTLNAGQTCIAPDYALCPKELVDEFAIAMANAVKKMFGETPEKRSASENFVHIVDVRAAERHKCLVENALANGATQILGGDFDTENRITPITILTGVTPEMDIMQSEIFGPILPIIAYETLDEAIAFIQARPKPLSLYIFGKSENSINQVLHQTSSGSTCINNVIIQIENPNVPFGGVGMSGTGNYHGIFGFKAFSHERNIMNQESFDVIKFFHAPYHNGTPKNFLQRIQKISEKALRLLKGM